MKVIRLCIQEFISGCLFCSIDWHICIYASQLPQWLSRWRICLQWRRHRRCRFNPWVKKIPWRRKWQPCPVFLPKKSPGQRSLGGLESKRSQKVKKTEQLSTHFLPNLHSSCLYFLYVLKSEASSFAVLSKIALPIWGALRFHVNCCMDFLYLKKNPLEF